MRDDELHLVDLALAEGAINPKQADAIRSELSMFPGQKAGMLLVRRGYIAIDILSGLKQRAAEAARKLEQPEEEHFVIESLPRPPQVTQAPPPPPAAGGFQLPPHLAARMVTGPPQPGGARPAAPGAPAPSGALPSQAMIDSMSLTDLLHVVREAGGSDLHVSVGRPPFFRRHGVIQYMQAAPVTAERAEQLIFSPLSSEQADQLRREQQLDFAFELEGQGRHRCNVYRQQYGWEGSYRVVPLRVSSFEELGLPPAVRSLTEYHNGMIVITGPAGSGKTTTVAAMIDLINRERTDHIITVEDPIEYVIPAKKCQVTQREAGTHTRSFGAALRAALREDPDVIMVGEMRDTETISIASSAAETGHLVLGTLHTNTATRTVSRIVDSYPPEQREQICTMVSKSMRGVIAQQLVPRKDGKGRVLALEILIFTAGVSAQVMEGKTHQLPSLMQTGKKIGMKLMDDALMELFTQGLITGREAWLRADNKPAFESIKER